MLLLFLTPFITALAALLLPRVPKSIAVAFALLPLLILLGGGDWIGHDLSYSWFPTLDIHFHLHMDGLSLVFVYLTAIIIPISLFAIRDEITHPNAFYALVLVLQGLLIGFFTVRDLAVFTIFWEAMLLPLYFIIAVWGGQERGSAAIKFLIYMIAGSVLMVAAILALYFAEGTFNLNELAGRGDTIPYAKWILAIFLLAFAVKTPLFPFHGWLPDAYYEAPTAGTILLSGLLSKAGIYGIVRVAIQLFPSLMQEFSPFLCGWDVAGVFYAGFAAWTQWDYKRLIAYSSLSHVNFILVGLFVWNETAHTGAILQALNHSITITALFLVAGWLYERLGSTAIGDVGGLAQFLPYLCWLTLFFVLSSVALPGTNNFIGELMILFGLFTSSPWLTGLLSLSVILSVMYMLRWMQMVYFQAPTPYQESWIDIRGREFAIATPLVLLILWIGIYPTPVLKMIMEVGR